MGEQEQVVDKLAMVGQPLDQGEGPDSQALGIMGLAMQLFTWGCVCSMVLGGVVPYIPQYRTIRRTRDAEGFSTFVCLVLLIANILRILFWFGKHYETPLLIQSIVMIIAMLAMMHICTTVDVDKGTVVRKLTDFDAAYFWKWTKFEDYCIFTFFFSLVGGLITLLLLNVTVYVELLGFASLMIEACLGIPQLYRNFINKSTEGMSAQMVIMWFSGDTFKTGYFLARQAPMQFWICGSLQVLVDVSILSQVLFYRKRTSSKAPKAHGNL